MSIPYQILSDTAGGQSFWMPTADGTGGKYITYEQFVTALVKERGSLELNLEHMIIGVAGEAGELCDPIKRFTIYGKELDRANVVEELGDMEFYMAGLRQLLRISREEVLDANFAKLRARYPAGNYSDEAAQTRADKFPPTNPTGIALEVIDVTKQDIANNPPIPESSVAAVDEMSENIPKEN